MACAVATYCRFCHFERSVSQCDNTDHINAFGHEGVNIYCILQKDNYFSIVQQQPFIADEIKLLVSHSND